MKKIFTLLLVFISTICAYAEDSSQMGRYYLDLVSKNDTKYFFTKGDDGLYTVLIPQLEGDFKIYAQEYLADPTNNSYSFGAADGQSYGVSVGDTKNLAHPGNNFSVEGGGILYNVTFEFDPVNMTLKMVSGSREPDVDPGEPTGLEPMLIGQFRENGDDYNWNPSEVIDGIYDETTGYYEFYVNFIDNGEFSFITKKGTSDSDWDTVNSSERYAPASNTEVDLGEWMPYEVFNGGTSNQWRFPSLARSYLSGDYQYLALLDPETKQVKIEANWPTGIEGFAADIEDNTTVDVISMTGAVIKSDVNKNNAVEGLDKGVYIIGGKKVLVK